MEISNSSPFSTALQAINKEFNNIAKNASEIAGYTNETDSPSTRGLAEILVDTSQSEQAVRTNLTVINKLQEIEDEVLRIVA